MISIWAFKWGERYSQHHVRAMAKMLRRNLTIPHTFGVISDDPTDRLLEREEIRYTPLWQEMRGQRGCGVRLRAFGADMAEKLGARFAWIDLDMVIVANVDHIFSRPEPLLTARPPRPPMPYQGSLVIMEAGAYAGIYDRWTPEEYVRAGDWLASTYRIPGGTVSDEGWLWAMLGPGGNIAGWPWQLEEPSPPTLSREDGFYFFKRDLNRGALPLPPNACIVAMNGRQYDPTHLKDRRAAPWIAKHWGK